MARKRHRSRIAATVVSSPRAWLEGFLAVAFLLLLASATLAHGGAPVNDDCASALAIGDGLHPFSTNGASTDGPDEPGRCDFSGYSQIESDVWFLYTAPCSGRVTIRTCGASFDTKVAVYDGDICPVAPSAIACDDDSCGLASIVHFDAVGGQAYLIRLGGFIGLQGVGVLDVACAPANDDCWLAEPIGPGATPFSNRGASTDGPDEPQACGFYGYTHIDSDVWFLYTAVCSGETTIDLCGSDFDTKVAVYDGSGCPSSASAIACDDDTCEMRSVVTFDAVLGNDYLIRVGGYLGEQGTGTILLSCDTPYDSCDSPGRLLDGATPFDNSGATTDGPDEPTQCGKAGYTQVESDIWYLYEATCTGTATIDLCASDFDTKVAVYEGADCPLEKSAIACNDDACGVGSQVSFSVLANTTYLVRVGGFRGDQGSGVVYLTCEPSIVTFCQGIDGVDTLRVNFDTGTSTGNVVHVDGSELLIADIARPAGAGNGKFLVHMNAGPPTGSTVVELPGQMGPFCFPALIQNGSDPVAIWNAIGKESKVGASRYFGTPIDDPVRAPVTFLLLPTGDPQNLPPGSVFTVQGVIVNPAASSAKGASVTNGILVVVE